ncbi:MAG: hypothetical protein OIF32_00690 [Campylobacterales bacterium]|nr:hypothetical protein [Campylobacterales bacterium]
MEVGSIQSRVDAISKAFQGEKPQIVNRTSKEEIQGRVNAIKEFTGLKDDIKTEAKSITNINDVFGGLKKSEKTLGKIDKALGSLDGSNKGEVAMEINNLVMNTKYKEKQLLAEIPLRSGDFNAVNEIAPFMSLDDVDGFKGKLAEVGSKIGADLSVVKQEIMSKTNVLGNTAQKSIDNSGISMDLGSITKSSNMDYLKQQMMGLLE